MVDDRTGTGYAHSLNTELNRFHEDAPLFERLVKSFRAIA